MADEDFCMHGCYPIDNRYFVEKGLDIDELDDEVLEEEAEGLQEKIKEEGVERIKNIADYRKVIRIVKNNSNVPKIRNEIGEKILDKMKGELSYKDELGEPYVGVSPEREVALGSSSQGFPMDTYFFLTDILDYRYTYNVHKVKETLNISPQSQYFQQAQERRKRAENSMREIMSNISDLYQQKHLLEHDIRKLKERVRSFERAEEGADEALKADFVDLVDANTGRSSILQMQSENVFPSITADFYRMSSKEDLEGDGPLADIPESEKAMLRKKWELYQRWKEQFGQNVRQKLEDLQMRLNSIETSIGQTEEWLRPYVRSIKEIHGTEQQELANLTNSILVKGYSSSVRNIKLVCYKTAGHNDHYKEVLVIDVTQLTFGGTKQPQSPGAGGEAISFNFKEYLVCNHVFEEAFQPQIDAMEKEVKRFIKRYKGIDISEEEGLEEEIEEIEKPPKLKNKLLGLLGVVDDYYLTNEELEDLREGDIGPIHYKASLYLDIKYGTGMFVMD